MWLLLQCVRVSNRVDERLQQFATTLDLNATQAWILASLYRGAEVRARTSVAPKSAATVAAQLGCPRSRVSKQLLLMLASGHIREQQRSPRSATKVDGRLVRYGLTDSGYAAARSIVRFVESLEASARRQVSINRQTASKLAHALAQGLADEAK